MTTKSDNQSISQLSPHKTISDSDSTSLLVYVMTHGPKPTWLYDYCVPLEVGAATRDAHCCSVRDNQGDDNISSKNKLYCELTGLYWMWKHDTHKYTGLYHYRRLFTISKKRIINHLKNYEWIVPKISTLNDETLESHYILAHVKEDWDILKSVLKQMYPEYYQTAEKVFAGNKGYFCNMFITSHEMLDAYCSWLFPLLFEIEKRINLNDGRSDYNKRAIGFMAERLFNVYLTHNHFKLKEVNVTCGLSHKYPSSIRKKSENCWILYYTLELIQQMYGKCIRILKK